MEAGEKAGRDAEFSAFMAEAAPSLLRTAWLLTGDVDRAQELVQAALVKTYVAWRRVRREDALAYARRVLVNHKTDVWRRTGREVPAPELPESLAAEGPSPVDHRDEVVRLLRRLPEQQRRVVVLRYYADLPEQAVAEMLGISVGAVKSSASRGLAALRAHLSATPAGEGSLR
ncbi:SigE family RNA polymerase sigma factor [Oryzihumus sp.]